MQDVRLWAWICLDLLTVIFALLVVRHYARRGFVQTLYSALKWILSLLLIRWLFTPVTAWLKTTGLEDYLIHLFEGWIGSAGSFGSEEFIEALPLPRVIIDYLKANNDFAAYAEIGVQNALSFVARTLADIVVNLIAMLGLIVLFQILFFLVGKALNLITHLPLLHGVNTALGGILGVGMALIFLWVLSTVLYLAGAMGNWPILVHALDDSKVLSFLNQWNFLLHYAYTLEL